MEESKIKVLDLDVAEKIAAGEVVERPFCVVKELIENSIDAGADRIVIEVKDRGVELIKVTDNGTGMDRDDLRLCVLRHATSKITEIDDLEKIDTMGFRGEALAAISRVSKVEIKTKLVSQDIGNILKTKGGSEPVIIPIGMNTGTQISIQDLFYNTPARKKFLKSKQSEYSQIISNVENISLAYPNISFKLIIDGKQKLNLNKTENRLNRIRDIFGNDLTNNLLPLKVDNGTLKLEGFISRPDFVYKKRNNYFFFMNNRVVVSKLVIGAVSNAYNEHIIKGRFPVVFLFANLSGQYFDINVHPRKIDIKFVNEQGLFSMIRQAIFLNLKEFKDRKILRDNRLSIGEEEVDQTISSPKNHYPTASLTQNFDASKFRKVAKSAVQPKSKLDDYKKAAPRDKGKFFSNFEKVYDVAYNKLEEPTKLFEYNNVQVNKFFFEDTKRIDLKKEQKIDKTILQENNFFFDEAKGDDVFVIGWLPSKFILANNKNRDLLIIDQHAAHERINYEQFKRDFSKQKIEVQGLLIAEIVELKPSLFEIAKENLKNFENFGFFSEEFGANSVKITAVPSIIEKGKERLSFMDMLETIADETCPDILENKEIIEKIIMISCKNSIKANKKLSIQEMEKLVVNLLKCENPYHCPHGRPTIIILDEKEIDKRFARITS